MRMRMRACTHLCMTMRDSHDSAQSCVQACAAFARYVSICKRFCITVQSCFIASEYHSRMYLCIREVMSSGVPSHVHARAHYSRHRRRVLMDVMDFTQFLTFVYASVVLVIAPFLAGASCLAYVFEFHKLPIPKSILQNLMGLHA